MVRCAFGVFSPQRQAGLLLFLSPGVMSVCGWVKKGAVGGSHKGQLRQRLVCPSVRQEVVSMQRKPLVDHSHNNNNNKKVKETLAI